MKNMNKKMMIFIALLAITPKLFSRRGVTVHNIADNTIKARVDYGPEKWIVVGPNKTVFIATDKYGARAVYWIINGVVYVTKPYSNPDYIKIHPDGYFIMKEKTIFGETEYPKAKATRTTEKKLKDKFYEEKTKRVKKETSIYKLKEMLKAHKTMIKKADIAKATALQLKKEQEMTKLIEKRIKELEAKERKKAVVGREEDIPAAPGMEDFGQKIPRKDTPSVEPKKPSKPTKRTSPSIDQKTRVALMKRRIKMIGALADLADLTDEQLSKLSQGDLDKMVRTVEGMDDEDKYEFEVFIDNNVKKVQKGGVSSTQLFEMIKKQMKIK